jgi:transcription-repair coupling factor (superfamily II helicase)
MVIVDEEQRLGVAYKEKKCAAVDVLTLSPPRSCGRSTWRSRGSARSRTPRPRTALDPHLRPAVRGRDDPRGRGLEVRRGGQTLSTWSIPSGDGAVPPGDPPDVRIGVAHGQMDEEGLSLAMDDFAGRRTDLLLCTAIIEAGLDIANANTILVNHAHRFGLAQLYQLRGRVGRDRHRAYAYFLLPKDVAMTRHATQRLAVLEELTELGSGFRIASHDLEIRGAGNLLGKDQSGQIHQVGYELYTQLLAEAMAELSGSAVVEEEEPELDLRIPAFLPDDYIPEAGVRLEFYRKLAMAKTVDAADELELELLDRFGRLPAPAKALCDLSRLRVRMREAGVRELKRGNGALYLTVSDRSMVDRSLLVQWVIREKTTFSFVRGEVLAMKVPGNGPEAVLSAAKNLLNRFPPGRSI